uniref:ATP synthase F0 subunit 8 n=1 Tax=Holothuria pervicax TaxID=2080420 RepID=A0A6B9XSU2_9ECHN|nr:ATP synthase F0 subunit 8 [Holothuria pervicax]QHR85446.1 ATP synthase F0 subunit 8 [Holothuria pervicax]
MPQLDLVWFLFNFLIAWTLALLVISTLSSQQWKSNTVTPETNQTNKATKTNNWQW